MQRLFRRWDVDMNSALTLSNVVTGLAHIKGTRDIMGSITYFFELYDDDGDGKVDREGILRISEALLFLSRRGLEGSLTPSESPGATPQEGPHGTSNERFLSSVSAFIRRCFEYADPDHPQHQKEVAEEVEEADDDMPQPDSFGIGDDSDEEEDLLDLNPSENGKSKKLPKTPGNKRTSQRSVSKQQSEAANAALDPSNPLHITLPTFRMVVLADELLEQFFESSFPTSFHTLDSATDTVISRSSNLTTFANLGFARSPSIVPGVGGSGSAGAVPPGKGLRGVLDNIVTDGMRVAAEVRRRVDEAQKDIEKNALQRDEDEEEEEIVDYSKPGPSARDADRRSVRSEDRDLLEGADAEAGSSKGGVGEVSMDELKVPTGSSSRSRSASTASGKSRVVEFEQ
jgi:hypothetical protein